MSSMNRSWFSAMNDPVAYALALLCALVMALLLSIIWAAPVRAATPASATLTATSGPVVYTAGPFVVANPTPIIEVDVGPRCNNPVEPCDEFALTVALPSNYTTAHPNDVIQVTQSWTDAGTGQSDYDLYVYPGTVTTTDGSQAAPYESAGAANPEVTAFCVFNGTKNFTIVTVPFTPTGETVTVTIQLIHNTAPTCEAPPFGQPTPIAPGVPRYQNFSAPAGSAADGSSGEFSIGFDPKTGNILTLSDINTSRVTPPENLTPPLPESGPAQWLDVSPSIVSTTTLDPILFTDQATGRTFQAMQTTGAEALFAYSDDDGATWTQASASPPDGAADHETVGAGPYPAGSPFAQIAQAASYPDAVYYCSQDIVGPAMCQRSDTGGASFGPGVPIYEGNNITACGGLHGHVKVGPDGAVYVPVPQCLSQQGGVVSLDAGLTWTQFLIPNSQSFTGGSTDPSVAIDAANNVYDCYVDGTGLEHHVHVAVSHDHGATWVDDTDIGAPVGVVMADFPEAVAGDTGRAACGFLGTNVGGDHESIAFPGIWYLYIATTYDGGKTWTTVNATPNDPVQAAGGIWNSGGGNQNRNLLDFNEVTRDSHGRVLFGYDEGCVSKTCLQDPSNPANNDFVAFDRVARQTGGKPLFAKYDPTEPAAPQAPYLSGTRNVAKADLSWNAPDNGGSDITSYQILRGTSAGSETLLATVSGHKTQYEDASVDSSVAKYFYQVVAVNAQGSSSASNELSLPLIVQTESPCTPPGLTILSDANGDTDDTALPPGFDLKSLDRKSVV